MAAARIWGSTPSVQQSLLGRLGWTFRSIWQAYLRWYEQRAARFYLTQLDDRMLQDIGITRAEIEMMVRDGRTYHRGQS